MKYVGKKKRALIKKVRKPVNHHKITTGGQEIITESPQVEKRKGVTRLQPELMFELNRRFNGRAHSRRRRDVATKKNHFRAFLEKPLNGNRMWLARSKRRDSEFYSKRWRRCFAVLPPGKWSSPRLHVFHWSLRNLLHPVSDLLPGIRRDYFKGGRSSVRHLTISFAGRPFPFLQELLPLWNERENLSTKIDRAYSPWRVLAVLPSLERGEVGNVRNSIRSNTISSYKLSFSEKTETGSMTPMQKVCGCFKNVRNK